MSKLLIVESSADNAKLAEVINGLGYRRGVEAVNAKQWPKAFKARFIEPGIARYVNPDPNKLNGDILVQKPFLDKILPSFVGKPVIDLVHQKTTPENFRDVADGVVIRAWYEPADGWYWCEFLVWDEAARAHCTDPKFSVSCQYLPTRIDQAGGTHHNMPYDAEFLDGEYMHLALVQDPRYEQAKIVSNSKEGDKMSIKNALKVMWKTIMGGQEVVNSMSVDGASHYAMCGAEKVALHDLVASYKEEKSAKEDKDHALAEDSMVEIDGENVPLKELMGAHSRKVAANKSGKTKEEEEAAKREHEAANAKAAEEKAAADKAAADKLAADNAKAEAERLAAENALKEKETKEKGKHIEDLKQAREVANNNPTAPIVVGMAERIASGLKKYGRTPGGK